MSIKHFLVLGILLGSASPMVTSAFGEEGEAPVAQVREPRSAGDDGDDGEGPAPVAKECQGEGCDHQPVGGTPGESKPKMPKSLEVDIVLTKSDEATLKFHLVESGEEALYRVQRSTDMKNWETAWEGNGEDADAGSFTVPFEIKGKVCGFYRVVAFTGE